MLVLLFSLFLLQSLIDARKGILNCREREREKTTYAYKYRASIEVGCVWMVVLVNLHHKSSTVIGITLYFSFHFRFYSNSHSGNFIRCLDCLVDLWTILFSLSLSFSLFYWLIVASRVDETFSLSCLPIKINTKSCQQSSPNSFQSLPNTTKIWRYHLEEIFSSILAQADCLDLALPLVVYFYSSVFLLISYWGILWNITKRNT